MKRFDDLLIRCPRLGGEVTFAYCRVEQGDLPCSRIIECWPSLPVKEWLQEVLTPEEWDRFVNRPPGDRISTIFKAVDSLKKKP
ncbi:MAG TPA: hypothetical protein ENN35_02735 [Deltaproteobacteria bacterium]|jgi:hypothetical protein|nr:hypothetical protein [Deltaproteobacteria bacterium]